jgi:hypothetical protein
VLFFKGHIMKLIDRYQKHVSRTNTGSQAKRRLAGRVTFCARKLEEALANPATTRDRKIELLAKLVRPLAQLASAEHVEISEVLEYDVSKTRRNALVGNFYDHNFPPGERLPRQLVIRVAEDEKGRVRMYLPLQSRDAEIQLGDPVTDNVIIADDFRFHDAFHLAYAAILGWSPVLRSLLKRKRKSKPRVDEAQDGARARDLEEQLAALAFAKARHTGFYENATSVDFDLLDEILERAQPFEVASRSAEDWEQAILKGFEIFRELCKYRGGYIHLDLERRDIAFHRTPPIVKAA